jgi:hypothetical protein
MIVILRWFLVSIFVLALTGANAQDRSAYYCKQSSAYYPAVRECAGPWVEVDPVASAQSGWLVAPHPGPTPQTPEPTPSQQAALWYYCDASKAYYPYVAYCAVPWRSVAPAPSPHDYVAPDGKHGYVAPYGKHDYYFYSPVQPAQPQNDGAVSTRNRYAQLWVHVTDINQHVPLYVDKNFSDGADGFRYVGVRIGSLIPTPETDFTARIYCRGGYGAMFSAIHPNLTVYPIPEGTILSAVEHFACSLSRS